MVRNVLMDCDPGIDDAVAITELIANQENLNILGITTVGGNQTLDYVTNNLKKLLTFFNENIDIASGQDKPLIKDLFTAGEIHGETGMDGYDFPNTYEQYPLKSTNAVDFMKTKIDSVDSVEIIATAPLTNIALLFKTYPQVLKKITRLYIMGGSLEQGNITPAAEFNFFVDPDAAKIVFNSGVSITMSGLHMTENKAFFSSEDINNFKNHGRVGQMCYSLMSFYHNAEKENGLKTSPMHDICAVTSFLKPELFTKKTYSIDIITESNLRGMSLADKRLQSEQKNSIDVLMDVDRIAFRDYLYQSIDKLN
ncbi:nucleoside hydrolase [Companilactobacillus sp. DQM5]|uniref:nucleoside hydrolase n=1 Tax=Companilactobacillus sp. DQM5 TaxID=3463359 RepID=UPI0040597317